MQPASFRLNGELLTVTRLDDVWRVELGGNFAEERVLDYALAQLLELEGPDAAHELVQQILSAEPGAEIDLQL
jgi:hypothetical protein